MVGPALDPRCLHVAFSREQLSCGLALLRRNDAEWDYCWDIEGTSDYIVKRSFSRITLQLPDHLLHQAFRLQAAVQAACQSRKADVRVRSLSSAQAVGSHSAKESSLYSFYCELPASCLSCQHMRESSTSLLAAFSPAQAEQLERPPDRWCRVPGHMVVSRGADPS